MMRSQKRLLLASVMGNALEFYDFTLYGALAAVLARAYFPGTDDTAQLLLSLSAFAAGFLTRPAGALLFGHLGDTLGRREALSLSILLMGLPTLLIGLAPSYATIGLSASLLIFVCRLLQGLFTGGEYNGAAIFSIEHFRGQGAGVVGGLITSSCVIGAIAATSLAGWSQLPGMPSWGWRVPFFLGGILAVAGFWMRRSIDETPAFSASVQQAPPSLAATWHSHRRSCLMAMAYGSFNGALSYTLFGFLNIYLSRYLAVPLAEAMEANVAGLLAFMVGSPLLGYGLDICGQRRYLAAALAAIVTLTLPIFLLLHTSYMVVGQVLLGLCVASIAGSGHAIMQDLFPVRARYRGISFYFSLGMGLFGGMTPMIYVYMIEQAGYSLLFPAYFIVGMALAFAASLRLLSGRQLATSRRSAEAW